MSDAIALDAAIRDADLPADVKARARRGLMLLDEATRRALEAALSECVEPPEFQGCGYAIAAVAGARIEGGAHAA